MARGTNSGAFNLVGRSAEFTYHFRQSIAATVDAGAYNFRGLSSGLTSTMYTIAAGPRITFRNRLHITPFAPLLVGGGRLTASGGGINAGENSVVVPAGAGLDMPLAHRFTLRAGQVDYLLTKFALTSSAFGMQQNVRLSLGLVIRFGER